MCQTAKMQLSGDKFPGALCCIISVVPLMLSVGFGAEELWIICCMPVMLIVIAVGVNLLVWSGTINGSFQKLLQEGDYTEDYHGFVSWYRLS